jgi:cyclic pyranopterin phosphate synthase
MLDQFGRRITYLRISVIDKCNLQCTYCMPKGLTNHNRLSTLLSNTELVILAELFIQLGIRKIRLTGGEPLLRPGLVHIVEHLARLPELAELAVSTNGVLLRRYAAALKHAGLTRVNISLDTLVPQRFAAITGMDCWNEVVAGILEAQAVGLGPVKVNTVLMKGVNDDEVLRLVDFAVVHGLELRFIEWMPTNPLVDDQREDRFVSNVGVRAQIEQHWQLIADAAGDGPAPATTFRIAGTQARVGFISPLSNIFCARCNRIRLKANGRIKTCLHGREELDLKAMLRQAVPLEAIKAAISAAVFSRPEEHFLNHPESGAHRAFVMTQIGG